MDAEQHLNVALAEIHAALAALRGEAVTSPEIANPIPPWMLTAQGELGTKEAPGEGQDNPRVLEYLASCSKDRGGSLGQWGASRDATPWCSAFVNWCIERDGTRQGTRSAWALSWDNWGREILEPFHGCIVVMTRGEGGHVGFYDSAMQEDPGMIRVLGGNQANAVNVRPYPKSRVVSYRWTA